MNAELTQFTDHAQAAVGSRQVIVLRFFSHK